MGDGTITTADRRTVGFHDYGPADGIAVLWCHGGPGSRLEPEGEAARARDAGLRLVGIDRPGYGLSTPRPGRAIADWVPDALAVADQVGADQFVTVGVSTGGAYSLAVAAAAPRRTLLTVATCALTDMRWAEGKAMMSGGQIENIWAAPDRETAMAIVREEFGDDGSGMLSQTGETGLAPADMELFSDPEWLASLMAGFRAMWAQGVVGYADDRIADGPGWGSFDVSTITTPVVVLHGGSDTIVPVAQAHHTASIVPGADLRIVERHGHFSISTEVVGVISGFLSR